MSTDIPTLREMGVASPMQIENYYVTSINAVDVLRIVYDRPQDSILPSSRSYKFPRVQKQSGDSKLSMHPKLRDAVSELDKVLEARSSKENLVAEILNEIALLEEDIAIRGECLRMLVKKVPDLG